jgi:serine/threonine protein kinase/tetratricopeptide (TPR) repeat protein
LDIKQEDVGNAELVCSRCGSITRCSPSSDTEKDLLDSEISGIQDDGAASMLLTMDYDPSADTKSRIVLVTPSSRDSGLAPGSPAGDSKNERKTQTFVPPQLTGYDVIEELGRGGFGVVYRARDVALGRDVALKTLQRMNPESLQQFKQEFRALADIAHPNLASLYELLSDGQTWCFSMELLEGVDFLEYVWSGSKSLPADDGKPVPAISRLDGKRLTSERIERLHDAMTQLAIGLSKLHEAGMLHSDIKPSNVLMTNEGRLVLLDFGLAVRIDRGDGTSKFIQGTPRYMSPEQARAKPLSAASDWYSVGVMLYELLTGRLPFYGKSIDILSQKQTESPIDPSQLQPDTPEYLSDVCVALLDRNSTNRPSASQVLRMFGATDVAEAVAASSQGAVSRLVELVGRERHFEGLRRAFAQVAAGDTLSTFVHGKSGMGKSVLLRSFLDDIKARNVAVVLEGRCYEQESVPFKALDSLIDSLADYLSSLPTELVQSVMPRDRRALTRVFPVLGGVPEVPGATYPSIQNADQQELRQRAMNALRELLQRLAIREPLVLYIDDLQWGDVDSAGLLADLVRPPDAPRMLLLASYRSEDVDRSACLQAVSEAFKKGQNLPNRQELSVDSLTEAESTQLALALLGHDDETTKVFANKIARESGGWPFFVWELVQHVQEDSKIADQTLALDEVIWSRVNRLPQESTRLLEMVAVAGRPMPAAELYQAVDAVSCGPRLLSQLRASHFVRTTESEENETLVEAYHDRIRESVFDHLDGATITSHNRNLALTIEQVCGIKIEDIRAHINRTAGFEEPQEPYILDKQRWQRVFDVAYFFDAAGESKQAFRYALLAAEQSRMQNALEVAEQQFRIALRGTADVPPELRFRVHEGLGDVLDLRGKYGEANEQFNAARELIQGNLLFARIDFKLGVASFKKGDMGEARLYFEKAIKALGERPPSMLTVLPRALKEAVIQVLHTYFPSTFVGRKNPQSARGQLELFRARIYDQLTFSYWFARGMNFVLWSHLRQMNLAERYPPSPELGKTYAFHAITMTGLPMAERGIAYAKKAYEISVDKGDLWGQGKARSYHAFACIVLARFKEGVETGLEAVQLLNQAGDVWESNMARMIATVPMYHLGDLKTAYRESKKAYEIGLETGDYSAVCISLLFWIPTNPKTIPPGAIQAELERHREDPLTIAGAVYARGLELLLCEDQPRDAAQVLQDSLDQAKRLGLRNVCLFSAATWKATALRMVAERESAGPDRSRAIGNAMAAVRTALKITKKYRACRPQALRERGLIAVLEEQEGQARRFFDESLQLAETYEARYDHAKTSLARGQAGIKFGWANAAQQIAQAQSVLDALEDF